MAAPSRPNWGHGQYPCCGASACFRARHHVALAARAFLSGTICATSNGLYHIRHAPYPKGPAGQATFHIARLHMVMGHSKNQMAAKDFLRWVGSRSVYEKWFLTQKGFSVGATREWSKHAMWNDDPIMLPFKDVVNSRRAPGWPRPASRKAAEAISKYMITDMYAKGVQGMAAKDAVKWAHGELAA